MKNVLKESRRGPSQQDLRNNPTNYSKLCRTRRLIKSPTPFMTDQLNTFFSEKVLDTLQCTAVESVQLICRGVLEMSKGI